MLSRVKLLGQYAALAAGWLFLVVVWLAVSTWIISPLLWVHLNSQSIFILIGRSLSVSMLLCLPCCLTNAKQLMRPSGRFNANDVFMFVAIVWLYAGVFFVILTLSSTLFLGYWILTKPIQYIGMWDLTGRLLMGAIGEPSAYYPMDSNGLAVQNAPAQPCVCPVVAPTQTAACSPLGYNSCSGSEPNPCNSPYEVWNWGIKYKECMNQKPTH